MSTLRLCLIAIVFKYTAAEDVNAIQCLRQTTPDVLSNYEYPEDAEAHFDEIHKSVRFTRKGSNFFSSIFNIPLF